MYNKFIFFIKYPIALLIFFGSVMPVYPQNHVIDSLSALLNQPNIDRTELLIELGRQYNISGDYETAISMAQEVLSIAVQNGDSANMAMAYHIKGASLRRMERLDEALELILKAYGIAKRNKLSSQMKYLLNSMALIYTNKAQYDFALDCNFQSLIIRESEGNKPEISIALNNIGYVYFKLKNYSRALEYFNKSLKVKVDIGDDYDRARLLINIGLSEVHLGNYHDATEHFSEGFAMCGDECSDEVKIEGEFGLGVAYYNLNKMEESRMHLNKSYFLAEKSKNHRFQSENLIYIGRILFLSGDFVVSEKMYQEAEQIALQSGYNQILLDVYRGFFNLYAVTKDKDKENFYQHSYILLKDSLISNDLVNNIAMIQAGFEERENIKTIKEQDEVLKLKEELISKVRAQYFFILTITILSILLTFVFVRFSRAQQRANVELAKAKREIENKNEHLEVSNAELDARVNERTRELEESNNSLQKVNDELDNFIYKTSHDIRGPLASLKGMTNLALMDIKDAAALEYFRKLDASAEKLNSILTRLVIVNHINHVTLVPEKVNCTELIDEILLLEKKKGIPSRITISYEVEPDLHLQTDRSVFRLALQNLIENAIKFHSESERITSFVKIAVEKVSAHCLNVTVLDNGIGIQESDQQKLFHMFTRASERSDTGGIGLYLAKLSAEKLGGQISYATTPEKYTQFTIELPLDLNTLLDKQKLEEKKSLALAEQAR